MNPKKIVNICLIIASVFLYLVASQFTLQVFGWLNVAVTQDYWLTIPEIISILMVGIVYLLVVTNKKAMGYFYDAGTELGKVIYPTPKESSQSAVIVIVIVALATVVLTLFDSLWSFLTRLILSS